MVDAGCQRGDEDSVHLCDWPTIDVSVIDEGLEHEVKWTRDVVRLGRRLRERQRIKTRQPLRAMTLVHHDAEIRQAVEAHRELLADELNVKEVRILANGDELATLTCKPNFKTLGRRYGKRMKEAAAIISTWGASEFATLEGGQTLDVLDEAVGLDDVIVRREASDDVVIETEASLLVALDTELDDALIAEGIAREFVSAVQKVRRDDGLAVTDRIVVSVQTADKALKSALSAQESYVLGEVLGTEMTVRGRQGQRA